MQVSDFTHGGFRNLPILGPFRECLASIREAPGHTGGSLRWPPRDCARLPVDGRRVC
jgi:hypothetical protein